MLRSHSSDNSPLTPALLSALSRSRPTSTTNPFSSLLLQSELPYIASQAEFGTPGYAGYRVTPVGSTPLALALETLPSLLLLKHSPRSCPPRSRS